MEVELREDHCLAQHRPNKAKKGPVTSSALFAKREAEDAHSAWRITYRKIVRK